MRFSLVAVALSAAVASVSATIYPRQLASCAAPCLAAAPLGSCASNNNTCLCHDQTFIANTTACIQSTCTGAALTQSIAAAQQLCLQAGVTLSGSVPSASSSIPASSSAAAPKSTSGALSNNANIVFGATAAGFLALLL